MTPSPYTLLGDIALPSNPVTFRFNNKGCRAEQTSDIDVFDPLSIPGVPDTLCVESDTIFFFRDPTPQNAYKRITSGGVTVDSNLIVGTYAFDSTHQAAILYLDSMPRGSERFGLLPSLLPPGTNSIRLTMVYRTTRTTSTGTVTLNEFNAVANVVIVPRPTVDLGSAIDPIYCTTGAPDTLRPSPAFDNINTTYFSLLGQDTFGNYTLFDSLYQDSIFVASMHYDSLVPKPIRNLPVQLAYTVNRYGCTDSDTAYTLIRAPLRPFFFTKPEYCRNESPFSLTGTLPGGISGRFIPAIGLDDSLGVFDPTKAVTDTTRVTYILTDQFNCSYDYTGNIVVREPPGLRLTLDGRRDITRFCGSVTSVDMRATLITGTAIDSIAYFGAGVLDSTLNPNSVFVGAPGSPGPGTGGTAPIWAQITDTFGCKGYDTLVVTIIQAPVVDIDSVFNRDRTNYGSGATAGVSDHTYCKSAPTLIVDGNPRHRRNGTSRGIISGAGIVLIDTTYFYDPSQVAVGVEVDTVVYTYTDDVGCQNTDIAIIKLDSVPIVTLSGFTATNYCPNYPVVQLSGTPTTVNAAGRGIFAGPGINPNLGIFNPALAGTGTKLITYKFTDNNNCESTDTVSIVVNPLPTIVYDVNYGGLNQSRQYCTAAADDTLFSLDDLSTGYYRFYGDLIIDSTGILSPGADTTTSTTTRTQIIYYSYTDSMNCTNTGSSPVFIHPTPEIELFGLDSAYCYSAPAGVITVSPTGGGFINSDPAFSSGVGSITLNPSLGISGIKTFTYGYTDNNGCSDTITARTFVYQPALPSVVGLDSLQCETRDTLPIFGTPSWGIFSGRGIYQGTVGVLGHSCLVEQVRGYIQ